MRDWGTVEGLGSEGTLDPTPVPHFSIDFSTACVRTKLSGTGGLGSEENFLEFFHKNFDVGRKSQIHKLQFSC